MRFFSRRRIATVLLFAFFFYAGVRGYYELTDGFAISNLDSALLSSARWETRIPSSEEQEQAVAILNQRFTYLGKGCQSYVFASEDGRYVIKFIKQQRFRTKPWLDLVSQLPWFKEYRAHRVAHKEEKLFALLDGWKIAFDELQQQTGVVWTHINKTIENEPEIAIVDKVGRSYRLDLNRYEYLLQKRAIPFTPLFEQLIADGNMTKGRLLLDRLIALILSTYRSGFADHDHALMQNTAFLGDEPLLVDVGQLAKEAEAAQPAVYKQALFNKSYRLRLWLKERSPELKEYLEKQLIDIIGDDFYTMHPHISV